MFFSYKHFRKLTAAVAAHVSAAVIAPASSLPDAADVGGTSISDAFSGLDPAGTVEYNSAPVAGSTGGVSSSNPPPSPGAAGPPAIAPASVAGAQSKQSKETQPSFPREIIAPREKHVSYRILLTGVIRI